MPPIDVHNEGVLKLLLDLQLHKATGPDKIPTPLLKEIAFTITPSLHYYSKHHWIRLVYEMIGKQF